MTSSRRGRSRLGWWALGLVTAGLLGAAVTRQSLVGDAPYHLLAGEQALREGRNLVNLEHPPLVKMIAALPLLGTEPPARGVAMDRAIPVSLELFRSPDRLRRAQFGSRTLLLALFGIPFLLAGGELGRRFGGPRAGWILGFSLALSMAVLPYLVVIQTDVAVALGFVITLLTCFRYRDRPGSRRAILIGAGLGLALASKYTGVLLLPTVALAILAGGALAPGGPLPWPRRLAHLGIALAVACGLLYSTYAVANRHYDPNQGEDTIVRYLTGEGMITGRALAPQERLLLAANRFDPGLGQWLTGLLGIRAQNEIGVYPSYAVGTLSSQGRWWYFPLVLALQTPLALLLAAALAAWSGVRRRDVTDPRRQHDAGLVAVTVLVYLGFAVTSNYNLGIRHLLPILPALYLPGALWVARQGRRTALILGWLAVEALALSPSWMSATNTWWLGTANPTRLALGSSEYHQDFLELNRAAQARAIGRLEVLYPLLDEVELRAYLPGASLVDASRGPTAEWVAVNILVEQFLPALQGAEPRQLFGQAALVELAETWTPAWNAVRVGEDHGWVTGTFRLYRVSGRAGSPPP